MLETTYLKLFMLCNTYVRMAERSKAPDSRVKSLSLIGVFWSTYVGAGSNPASDSFFSQILRFWPLAFRLLPYDINVTKRL